MTTVSGIGGFVPGLLADWARKIALALPFVISVGLFAAVIYVHMG